MGFIRKEFMRERFFFGEGFIRWGFLKRCFFREDFLESRTQRREFVGSFTIN